MYIVNPLQKIIDFNVSLEMTTAILVLKSHNLSICPFILSSKYMMVNDKIFIVLVFKTIDVS